MPKVWLSPKKAAAASVYHAAAQRFQGTCCSFTCVGMRSQGRRPSRNTVRANIFSDSTPVLLEYFLDCAGGHDAAGVEENGAVTD